MCYNTEQSWEIWERNDVRFEKWLKEFFEFWLKTRKSQNLNVDGLLFDQTI